MERYEVIIVEDIMHRNAVESFLRKIFVLEKSVFSETNLKLLSHTHDCLALFHDAHPVAAVCFKIAPQGLTISCFGVAFEYRRQGLGKMLMKEIFSIAGKNGYQAVHIDTLTGARPFFIANGFRETEKPRILDSNNAFVNMTKELLR